MAKPKGNYRIKKYNYGFGITFAQVPPNFLEEIRQIEGITRVSFSLLHNDLIVVVNQLYDRDEIIAEVEQLLSSEVPSAFNE